MLLEYIHRDTENITMTKRITTDTEYWQLKDDTEKALLACEAETDKKLKKQYQGTARENMKLLEDYEKRKKKETLALVKKEVKLAKIRNKAKADKQIFFTISDIESKYIDFTKLDEKQRNKLSVKKESMIEMMRKGMYVKLKDDSGIYQVKQSEDYMDGMNYLSTARYSDVPVQEIALIIDRYYYESELNNTGHKVS